jgi:predicted alpha/beta-fold hydrolase
MNSIFEVDKWIYNIEDDKYAEWKNANSCINSIKNIKQTTLFIQSKEDPFTQ